MDKILEFINKQSNNKFKDLLFFGAEFEKQSNSLTVIFNRTDEIEISNLDRENLLRLTKEYVKLDVDYTIKIKTIKFDLEICLNEIRKIFFNKKELLLLFDANAVDLQFRDGDYYVVLPCKKEYISNTLEKKLKSQILSIFSKYGIEDFYFEYGNNDIKHCEETLEKRISSNSADIEIEENETPKFLDKEDFIGKIENVDEFVLATNKVGNLKNLLMAGIISKVYIKEFTKNDKIKKFANFTLTNGEDKVSCVCFSKDIEKIPELENKEVLVLGDVDNYNESLSFKVRAISTGKIIKPEIKMKKVNSQYLFVKPTPYFELLQSNFLSDENTITKDYLLNNSFVIFDLETTGLSSTNDRIIEIGAVKLEKGKITQQFSTFVNPEMPIPPSATKINNITDEMVKDAPTMEQALPDFYKFCYGSTIVAYNIEFDFGFINYYGKKILYDFNNPQDDAYKWALKNVHGVKNHKLGTICDYFNISLVGAHRAVNDTIATAKLFVKLVEKFG